jgi:hypothetical protein
LFVLSRGSKYTGIPFPGTLPSVATRFSSVQLLCTNYGLREEACPRELRVEISRFSQWSTALINTTRSDPWTTPVQSTSIEKTCQVIRGYIGFCSNLLLVPDGDVSLDLFLDPGKIAWFLSYLKARGAGRDQILKQVSVARKVADFLKAESMGDSALGEHVAALDMWLQRLSSQLSASMPPPEQQALPPNHTLRKWSDNTLLQSVRMIEEDLRSAGSISKRTAIFNEQAVIVGLVVGNAVPPVRLDVIKNLPHPKHRELGCLDDDCLRRAHGQRCAGNRLTVQGGDIGEVSPTGSYDGSGHGDGGVSNPLGPGTVTIHILHGKNDRRPTKSTYEVDVPLPEGDLSTCLRVHIREGRKIMTQENGEDKAKMRLFVTTRSGHAFNDVTFVQFWHKAMRDTKSDKFGIAPFPPSQARNSFVEAYTDVGGGAEPQFWEGASAIMGNTTGQWRSSYNPSRRQRAADAALGTYAEFTGRQRTMGS